MSYLISDVMLRAAAKLNDVTQSNFTNIALLPFAKDAADELQAELELNGILALETVSATIIIPVNTKNLGVLAPTDMLEPQRIEERLSGTTDQFREMIRTQWEPNIIPSDSLMYWDYRDQDIFFAGATTIRDIHIYYLKQAINIVDGTSTITVNNSEQFMINRVAALAARYIGENPERASELDNVAKYNLSQLIRIGVKSKQGTRTRRRPFRINRGAAL